MFQPLNDGDVVNLSRYLLSGKVSLVGRLDNHAIVLAKSTIDDKNVFSSFNCTCKTNKPVESNHKATFSFVTEGNKFLFSAECIFYDNEKVIIKPTTQIYTLQRRNFERIYLPEDYYAVIKISYHNMKLTRFFAKMANISAGGCSLIYRSETPSFKSKDIIKGSMHFNSRPPIDFEGEVRYRKVLKDNEQLIQNFGILFLPSNSLTVAKKMKVIIMDIYRDLFTQNNRT